MKYAAAYLLAAAAGKDKPSAKDVKKILGAIDTDVDDDALNKLVDQLSDSTIHEVIAKGRETLKSVPMGGGGGGGGRRGEEGGGGACRGGGRGHGLRPLRLRDTR